MWHLQHGAGGDFHIMAKFEILNKGEGLVHGNITVGFEEHHCGRKSLFHDPQSAIVEPRACSSLFDSEYLGVKSVRAACNL